MDIQFSCDACGQLITVNEELCGSAVNCPNAVCSRHLIVPSKHSNPADDITFECPFCCHLLVVDKKGVGCEVACPECGKAITIPYPLEPAAKAWTPPPVPTTSPRASVAPIRGSRTSGVTDWKMHAPYSEIGDQRNAHDDVTRKETGIRNRKLGVFLLITWALFSFGPVLAIMSGVLTSVLAFTGEHRHRVSDLKIDEIPGDMASGCTSSARLEVIAEPGNPKAWRLSGSLQVLLPMVDSNNGSGSTYSGPVKDNNWGVGATHTIIGIVEIKNWTFKSDRNNPLVFRVSHGYFYQSGSGSVTDPHGRIFELGPNDAHSGKGVAISGISDASQTRNWLQKVLCLLPIIFAPLLVCALRHISHGIDAWFMRRRVASKIVFVFVFFGLLAYMLMLVKPDLLHEKTPSADKTPIPETSSEEVDVGRSFTELRTSAEHGDARAQALLGACYADGRGVLRNEVEAVKWFRMAADKGIAGAQYSLGECYKRGIGVPKDDTEAAKWYCKAAEQGFAEAQTRLGLCYEKGLGVSQNDAEAAKWYLKAAINGNASAQFLIGYCYRDGRGVGRDFVEAAKWYRKAAEQGDTKAQFLLGLCYLFGDGFAKDCTEAVKWFRRAAEQGDAQAQYQLACCYGDGQGVTRDSQSGYQWLLLAAAGGDKDAANLMSRVEKKLTKPQVSAANNWVRAWKPVVERAALRIPVDSGATETPTSSITAETQHGENASTRESASGGGAPTNQTDLAQAEKARTVEQEAASKREEFNQLIIEAEEAVKGGDLEAAQKVYERAAATAPTDIERMQTRDKAKRAADGLAYQKRKDAFDDLMQRGLEAEEQKDWQGAKAVYIEALATAPDAKTIALVRTCGSRVMVQINSQAKENPSINHTVLLGLVNRRVLDKRRPSSATILDGAGKVVGAVSISSSDDEAVDAATITFKGRTTTSIAGFNAGDPIGTSKVEEAEGLTFTSLLTEVTTGRNGSKGLFIRTITVKVTATRSVAPGTL